jgi:hypothetical protein
MVGLYDYMKLICVCPGRIEYLAMRTLAGAEVYFFPVTVYNVNEEPIGVANDKQEYINIWNSDYANNKIGILAGLIGPFSFQLHLKPGQVSPPWVIGENGEEGFILTEGGDFILTEDGGQIPIE